MTAFTRLRSTRTPHRRSLWRAGTVLPVVLTAVLGTAAVVATSATAPAAAPAARAVSYKAHSPVGHLDTKSMTPGGLHVRGWSIDPSSQTRAVRVYALIDGRRASSVAANGSRPDVRRKYPKAGAAHGFDWRVSVPEGRHTVCIRATNVGAGANVTLGCRTTTFHYGPIGTFERATATLGTLHLSGWTLDGDAMHRPLSVRAVIDGVARTLIANRTRNDIAKAHPRTGTTHGFAVALPVAQGTHRVCLTAVNIGYGTNTSLGCRTVVLNDSPVVGFNALQQTHGALHVYGWAFDRDAPTTPVTVDVRIGSGTTTLVANRPRSDVAKVYPGTGSSHGFDLSVVKAEGQYSVCATAHNIGFGSNSPLGCKTIVINFTPTAALAVPKITTTGVTLSGWASDPDTSNPVVTTLQMDNATVATVTANGKGTTHTGHNFTAAVAARSGTHKFCAIAINVLYGTRNSTPSCRTVTVALSPFGRFDSLTRAAGTSNLLANGWAIDADNPAPLSVVPTLDGKAQSAAIANVTRTDVAKVYPGFGSAHGLSLTVPADAGEHTLCLTAKNVGGGADVSLGCKLIFAVHPVVSSAPRAVTAQAGFGGAIVTWQAPTSDGGAPWTGYTVVASPGGHTTTAAATATSIAVTGLKASTTYTFSVRAVNVAGSSAAATSAAARTQAGPPAQNTPAPISTSRYIRNVRGSSAAELATMRAEGVADAKRNVSGHGYLVLLDIGGQDAYDQGVVLSATTRFVGYGDLVRDIQAYIDGYHSAQKASAPVTIAIGTNNDMDVTVASGKQWATSMVNPLVSYVAARYTSMQIAGANDIEPGFRASYAATRSWLAGYLAATNAPFVFNGSADGCAWTVTNRSCNNGWTMAGLQYLAAGASPTRMLSLPQVYNNTMADQWKYISLTGLVNGSVRINFAGVLTEATACAQAGGCGSMSGRSAWTRLWNDLQSDSRLKVGSLPYSTDLRIDH